jgi:DNA-binding transcriptional MerR regulator
MSVNRTVRKLTSRMLCERYSVATRTIDRWAAAGILPQPLVINGYRYWDEAEVEQFERARVRVRSDAEHVAA